MKTLIRKKEVCLKHVLQIRCSHYEETNQDWLTQVQSIKKIQLNITSNIIGSDMFQSNMGQGYKVYNNGSMSVYCIF